MNWWKKLTTNWQYEYNTTAIKLFQQIIMQNKALNERIEVLEKFALESGKYFELIEERRKADLAEKKGK